MDRRRANWGFVTALLIGLLVPGSACAQQALDVFPETMELPALEDEQQPTDLPPPEELPAGATTEIDSTVDSTATDPDSFAPAVEAERSQEPLPAASPPADTVEEDVPLGLADVEPEETIRERYPDGNVRVERGVRQDELQNYLNHGPWKMWDPQGRLVVEGAYRDGEAEGRWVRWYQGAEAPLLSTPPFDAFVGPFASRATFQAGQLNGHWVITDQNDRKICDWNFVDGRRDGVSLWWYPNGNKMREIHYVDGQVHGELLEWDEGGRVVTRVKYEEGRRLDKTAEQHKNGQKQVEGMVLHARLIMKQPDDWWKAKLATYVQEGKDQKHGPWAAWYQDGKRKFTGHYEYDRPTGEFTWWHPNGQRALQGEYQDGVKDGTWTWWHANGQKSIEGRYQSNQATGRWVWWHESGKVAQRVDFSGAGGQVVHLPGATSDLDGDSMGRSIMLNRPRN